MTGSEIRAAREALGLRQLDLARIAGVTRAAVSRWERGADRPSPDSLRRISGALRGSIRT